MSKTGLFSLELAAIMNELQTLAQAKITSIHQFGPEFLFQLHQAGKGKLLLRIVPGKLLGLTKKKEAALKPTEFCLQLRRWLEGGIITSLRQKEAERIVVLEVDKKGEKEDRFLVIIELFSKGNIIVTDQNYVILTLFEQQEWKDRQVKRGEKYLFPKAGANWKQITGEELAALLSKSGKRNLVTALATELGLGGLYAEELCIIADVDKVLLPAQVSPFQITSLRRALTHLLNLIMIPQGYFYPDEITPFPLTNQQALQITVSYAEAVDTIIPFPKSSPYLGKISQLQHTLIQQEQAIVEYQQSSVENRHRGELIYENYAALQKLLAAIQEWKQQHGWEVVAQELQKLPKIKQINLKEKTIIVEC
ncbi:MAG: NFACT family protein [Nanoarchaeota archaeon]